MTSSSALAQDGPWWKNLFKKETVEEIEDDTIDTTKEETDLGDLDLKDTIPVIIPMITEPGLITITTPFGLDTLNRSLTKKPKPINGFRIQIFFGSLSTAKTERSSFMGSHEDQPCYLVQNVPNYAVRVGDFRSELEAHRQLQELKLRYPSAYIVPDEIEFPELAD